MNIESGIIDEEALAYILQQNGYLTRDDLQHLYDLIQTCIDKTSQIDLEIDAHKADCEVIHGELWAAIEEDKQDLVDYKLEMEEKLGDIAALLDEINGEII
jgi:hypothetical protein